MQTIYNFGSTTMKVVGMLFALPFILFMMCGILEIASR